VSAALHNSLNTVLAALKMSYYPLTDAQATVLVQDTQISCVKL